MFHLIFATSFAIDPMSIYEVNNFRDLDFKGLKYDNNFIESFTDEMVW